MDVSSKQWLSVVVEVMDAARRGSKKEPDQREVCAALVSRFRVSEGCARAVCEGIEGLFGFLSEEPGDGGNALDDEREAMAMAMRLAAPLAQARMQKRADRSDAEVRGKARCKSCGEGALSLGRRSKTWNGLGGKITLRRRVVHCAKCKCGSAPSEERMGLGDGEFTPRMEEVSTLLGTTVPYQMASELLAKLLGVEVSATGVQRMVERRGQSVEAILKREARELWPYDEKGLPRAVEAPVAAVAGPPSEVAYLEMDGVVPMTREEKHGAELSAADKARQRRAKKAKARGGRGRKYRLVGREVKNAVLYDGADCAQESPSRGCLLDKHYVSHLGDWRQFGEMVWAALSAGGLARAKKLVVIGDGAEWIRSVSESFPVPTLLILDLFHAKHRIWAVANLLHGEHSPTASAWAHRQCDRVEAGKAVEVIEALRFLGPARKDAREAVAQLTTYLSNHLDRMDYPSYRAQGLRVTSGIVESANFHVTGARLKLQGMRWSEQGAREMAYLRADLFNGSWEARSRQLLAA